MNNDIWRPELPPFPEAPDHPDAQVLAPLLQQVQALLRCWRWLIDDDGVLTVFVQFSFDEATMRVTVFGDKLDVDVYSTEAEFTAQTLHLLMMWNAGTAWKAHATPVEQGRVPIYVGAVVDRSRIDTIGTLVWEGLENALLWRGRIMEAAGRVSQIATLVRA